MEKQTFWWIVGIIIAILVVVVIWQTGQLNGVASGNAVASTGQAAASSSSGMVGGC